MSQFEEITVGASVIGLTGSLPVRLIVVKWHLTAVLMLTFAAPNLGCLY